ncbi:hypothetical protein SAMN02746095_03733 [Acidocella aminolytica 101 = DSM 11237]|uniref:Uncharacterized protein n=1 Tax=Acidocella aminolytica 101 = DSM 11237 TaxID=1120923 RepID=A0A0D6PJ62_9PROT|nr:hypothetical protein Aam_093_006 [Acidocella aminolytica 101 = DSM 11237]GBQ32427.1 hypothetical protein AA11237_0156 [Acidocella aminolytica 101 = DSM 11237]SHF57000.1 hypothetical protein SAMN02746095_03733 [Acidocella aminolytica 101 = DSM 11237]
MQSPKRKPTSRQPGVELGYPEGQNLNRLSVPGFNPLNLGAQLFNGGFRPQGSLIRVFE